MLSSLAGLAGCGGDDAEQTRTTALKRSELTRPADSGRFEARACSAHGGAGAWWTRATRQLVAYDEDKMIKLRVNVRAWATARHARPR